MAINRAQTRKAFESGSGTTEQRLNRAKKETEKAPAHKKKVMANSGKEYDEEGLVKKTKRRLKELYYGERAYTKGHKAPKKPKKTTERTKQVSSGLKAAGLSDEEIAKFRKK